tara:strand:+ start:453 stop:629 length:177 start_codon:yes stop_codon:yes gene_type:complete
VIDPIFKLFMEEMWTTEEVNGVKVIDRHLGFGSLPDIKLWLEDGSMVSAKELWNACNA